jgi:hypothetical protein
MFDRSAMAQSLRLTLAQADRLHAMLMTSSASGW